MGQIYVVYLMIVYRNELKLQNKVFGQITVSSRLYTLYGLKIIPVVSLGREATT